MRRILLLFSLSLYITASAQKAAPDNFRHQFGLNMGSATGIGLSYKYWPGKLGIQMTFLPIHVNSEWNDLLDVQGFAENFLPYTRSEEETKFISIGLAGFLTLKEYRKYRLISYLGNHLIFKENDEIYNIGGGVGISFDAKVSFNLMIGYGAYDITNSAMMFPTAEIGFFFRFESKNKS